MNDPNTTDWLTAIGTCVIPIALALGPVLVWWFSRPRLVLKPNIDRVGDKQQYMRLTVENKGTKIAKKCVGRLIEIANEAGEIVGLPQLDFCWERHNQANPPHPVDIPKVPFSIHLDIAKYEENSEYIELRVDADNQQLSIGTYQSEFRLLRMNAATYHVLVSVYTEDGYATSGWYILKRSGSGYTIADGKPSKKRER